MDQKKILEVLYQMDKLDRFPFVLQTQLERKNDFYFAVYRYMDDHDSIYYQVKINSSVYHANTLTKCLIVACENSIYWERVSGRKQVAKWLSIFLSNIEGISFRTKVYNWIRNFF